MFCEKCGKKMKVTPGRCVNCGTETVLEGCLTVCFPETNSFRETDEKVIAQEMPKRRIQKLWIIIAAVILVCTAVSIIVGTVLCGADGKEAAPKEKNIVTINIDEFEENESYAVFERPVVFKEVLDVRIPEAGEYKIDDTVLFEETVNGFGFTAEIKENSILFRSDKNEVYNVFNGTIFAEKSISDIWVKIFRYEHDGKTYFGAEKYSCAVRNYKNGRFDAEIVICELTNEGLFEEFVSASVGTADDELAVKLSEIGIELPEYSDGDDSFAEKNCKVIAEIQQIYEGKPEELTAENEGNKEKIPPMKIKIIKH